MTVIDVLKTSVAIRKSLWCIVVSSHTKSGRNSENFGIKAMIEVFGKTVGLILKNR
jgi:hypothetical protein